MVETERPMSARKLQGLATYHDDVLDIGLDMHGLLEDEQEALLSEPGSRPCCLGGPGRYILPFLCLRVAEQLEVEWPSPPPAQKFCGLQGAQLWTYEVLNKYL